MDGRARAIIAHITLIGWVIALVVNSGDKKEFTSFYLRQTLLFNIIFFVGWVPLLGWILAFAAFVFWLISLVNAIQGNMKPVPVVGTYFQEWFKSL